MKHSLLFILLFMAFIGCKKDDIESGSKINQAAAQDSFLVKVLISPYDSTYNTCQYQHNNVGFTITKKDNSGNYLVASKMNAPLYEEYSCYVKDSAFISGLITRENGYQCAGNSGKNRYRIYIDGTIKKDTTDFFWTTERCYLTR